MMDYLAIRIRIKYVKDIFFLFLLKNNLISVFLNKLFEVMLFKWYKEKV